MSFRIFGVIHLAPMPGDLNAKPWDTVMDAAMADAEALVLGGIHGIIVENFGSSPFYKGTPDDALPPHQVAFMAKLCSGLRRRFPKLTIGVNCLRNDARAAIGIAASCGLNFVRINIHTGAFVTDQGLIEGRAAHTLRYRSNLGADQVQIFADVMVKHAQPLAPIDTTQAVKDTIHRGHASAVIVSGSGTGEPTSVAHLSEVKAAAGNTPVWIGSGFNPESAAALMEHADGAIVGTFFKRDGIVSNHVDANRVTQLIRQVQS